MKNYSISIIGNDKLLSKSEKEIFSRDRHRRFCTLVIKDHLAQARLLAANRMWFPNYKPNEEQNFYGLEARRKRLTLS